MSQRPQNWVFLGDSLTEGIGSSRVSYVTELAAQLRSSSLASGDKEIAAHELRLRKVNPDSFNRFIRFNFAGHFTHDERMTDRVLWLWNLACEGTTIESDFEWLPLINNLQPELVVVFRGSLESIVRPAMFREGDWPWWVPRSWRGYAAMDPRCYYSMAWWRKAKQSSVDRLKQESRHRLLQRRTGEPLMESKTFINHFQRLLAHLRELCSRVLVLGVLPVDGRRFPGSPEAFGHINRQLNQLAAGANVDYVDWSARLSPAGRHELFYRDGFHPNHAGAHALASILSEHLFPIIK